MNRIKLLREEKRMSQEELASKLELSKGIISMYENESRKPSYEVLIKLSEIFNCSIDYIVGNSNEKTSNVEYDLSQRVFLIPLLGRIPAGEPILADENIECYYPISPNWYGVTSPDNLFFLKVVGDSMNNKVENGSLVLVRKQDFAENGDIVIALVNGDNEATMKEFEQINSNLVVLKPDSTNKEFANRYIDLSKTDFKIIGKVIGNYKKMN